jgi:hypothetical protein
MPGVFPDYPAPVIRNTDTRREMVLMRWGMPPPPRTDGSPVTIIRNMGDDEGPRVHCRCNGDAIRCPNVSCAVCVACQFLRFAAIGGPGRLFICHI